MARYIDGFVIPVRKAKLAAYRRLALIGARVWMKHGALAYCECVGDDLASSWGTPFPQQMRLKKGETALFSWILYRSKAHRKSVNAKVMKDPAMDKMMGKPMPFDMKRMCVGGFAVLVEA